MSATARLQSRVEVDASGPAAVRLRVAGGAGRRLEHRQYALMQRAFRESGGLVGGDELARWMRCRHRQPVSRLARWIVDRAVISFEWQGNTVLPLFQFDLSSLTLRPRVDIVVRELRAVFDGWELALWFARPNAWLECHAPIEKLDLDPDAVFDAARADRFIARC